MTVREILRHLRAILADEKKQLSYSLLSRDLSE